MGLEFMIKRLEMSEVGCSYSGFNEFRKLLAEAVTIDLDEMEGFKAKGVYPGRSWYDFQDEPLVPLLRHSDCDGEMSADELRPIAERIKGITLPFVDWLSEEDVRYWQGWMNKLRQLMEEVILSDAVLVFG